jgi:hypothetical protein
MGLGGVVVSALILYRFRLEKRSGLLDQWRDAAILAMGEAWQ